jgi:hypothetical protein
MTHGTPPIHILDGFLPQATASAMRRAIDAHFAAAEGARAETHQIWDYRHVPNHDTFLRTSPEKLMVLELVQGFVGAISRWSVEHLGLGAATWPWLSLHVSFCRQDLHRDAGKGRFGFVYSLTRDDRKSQGGSLLVLDESEPFRAGRDICQPIEPRFNRLVLVDERLPQGVSMVEGAADPAEGLIVLQGHLSESGPIVAGALPGEIAAAAAAQAVASFAAPHQARLQLFHGFVTLRLTIAASGRVEAVAPIADRVLQADAGDADWPGLRRRLESALKAASFPPAAGPTSLILPIAVGSPL